MPKIVLIGTSHNYQVDGPNPEIGRQFRHLLRLLCAEYGIKAIAEEMNQAALDERGATESIACVLAAELKLGHQFSDPSPILRKELAVRSENEIKTDGFLYNWADEHIDAEVRKSHDIRERYWLNQLLILNSWPLLFICGANHVEPFLALLRKNDFEVIAPFFDWEPNQSAESIQEST